MASCRLSPSGTGRIQGLPTSAMSLRRLREERQFEKKGVKQVPELGVNKVVLIGRSGGNAELKFTAGGKPCQLLARCQRVVQEPGR